MKKARTARVEIQSLQRKPNLFFGSSPFLAEDLDVGARELTEVFRREPARTTRVPRELWDEALL